MLVNSMLFADDIVLVDESRDCVAKLQKWWEALESKGFKISHTKIEYMDSNFNRHIQRATTTVRIKALQMPQRDAFHHIGLIISKDGKIHEDVKHRIKVRQLKWRFAYGVLCNRLTRLKEKFYMTAIRLRMTYGEECEATNAQNGCSKDENVMVDVWENQEAQNQKCALSRAFRGSINKK